MAKTILIVEDDALNSKLFHDVLLSRGYHVSATDTGREAMAIIAAHPPDLVIMDVRLRGDLTGLDVVRWMKSALAYASIPVLVVTAYAMTADRPMIAASGCDDAMTKPIDVRAFLARVEALLPKDA
jgi:two-component system, cell cycle response regulator DivK